jgi:HD-GYP domain-containing protein (c-di-GMP phosphodiesterase class II)
MLLFDRSVKEIQAEQKAFEELLGTQGRDLVNVLNATMKVAAMYEPNNNRYIEQSSRLRGLLGKICEEEPDFTLVAKGGHFYISDVRIKVDRDSDAATSYFLETWPKLGISGFSFSKGMDPSEVDKFIYLMKGIEPGDNHEENYQILKTRFDELSIERISPIKYVPEDDNDDDDPEKDKIRARARKTFFSALAVVQTNVNQARNQGNLNIAKTKRAVQGLIDVIIEDEAAMMEMTALRNFDDYTFVHSVNVCVLSLVLGYHLGLDRRRLSNMGVGALLHDIGKTSLPIDLVNKPDSFDEYDWNLMRKHPVFGLKFLFKTRRVDDTTVRASTVVFEHHIGFDGSGYPELLSKRKPSLYARIVAIADSFNAMTSGRVYHRKKFLPDEAITSMINRIGTAYDPLLLKIFINSVGVYPVGTVVALDSREIGIVSRNNPENPERPQVKIIGNETGLFQTDEVKVIDLSLDTARSITRMIDGEKYNIDNANYLDIG